ncbi:Hypothetical protein BCD_1341 (plasmid) [Borrelia crocidurae DOU]|uniref:Lipoprotein n=1 Tax=Borrelia crocidurae DOU TaxID=1293575 RepID=W5SKH8_9SPIR|nr:hypothetical protein [Borrelia crocidurae]AHH07407.1 Hypothetical protein BCD_1341 [Borrelia crocidurae DOU]
MSRMDMGVLIIVALNLFISCSAVRKDNFGDVRKVVFSKHLDNFDLPNLDLYITEGLDLYRDLPMPITPYESLKRKVQAFRISLDVGSKGFDKSKFDGMFNGFNNNYYFKDDYSKNCVYIAMKYNVAYLEKVKRIVDRLMSVKIDDPVMVSKYENTALNFLIVLQDIGIYVLDVVEENGELLSNSNLDMLQEDNDLDSINSISVALDNLSKQKEDVFNLLIDNIENIVNLKKIASIKYELDLIIGNNGDIFNKVDSKSGLFGFKEIIKEKIVDLKEQRARKARIYLKLKGDSDKQKSKKEN